MFVPRSDMDRWMVAFPNPDNSNRDEDEVIYEDWGEECSEATVGVCFIPVVTDTCVFLCDRLSTGAVCGAVHRATGRRTHPGAH